MTRAQIEAAARKVLGNGARFDGLDDQAVKMLVLARVLPGGLPVGEKQSSTYIDAAFDALGGPGERRDAAERVVRRDVVRLDEEPRLDASDVMAKFKAGTEQAWKNPTVGAGIASDLAHQAASTARTKVDDRAATLESLVARTAAARENLRLDAEQAYLSPTLGARADAAPAPAGFSAPTLTQLAEGLSVSHRAAAGIPTAEEAAAALRERTENAWREPTVGVTSASLLGTAEEISARHAR